MFYFILVQYLYIPIQIIIYIVKGIFRLVFKKEILSEPTGEVEEEVNYVSGELYAFCVLYLYNIIMSH